MVADNVVDPIAKELNSATLDEFAGFLEQRITTTHHEHISASAMFSQANTICGLSYQFPRVNLCSTQRMIYKLAQNIHVEMT
jgi:hypothetical protein